MPESSNKGGRKPRVADEDLLDVFRSTSDPALSTAEVAEALPIKRRGTLNRLRDLEAAGELDSKQIGGRNTVWWVIDKPGESRPESDPSGKVGGSPETTLDTESEELDTEETPTVDDGLPDEKVNVETTEPDTLADAVRSYLDGNDIPPKTEHGRDAVIDVFRYLREHGTAKTGDIQDAVYSDYEDNWSTPRTMWNALDRHLEAVPGIEKSGYGKWAYAGDDTVRGDV